MRLLVIGDYISDVYTFGSSSRICPEAPVPAITYKGTWDRSSDGGAGLVAAQLKELGCEVIEEYGSYSTKHRIFVGNHLVCRLDCDSHDMVDVSDCDLNVDAIVVSDYGKGAMTEGLAAKLRDSGKPLFVDAKHNFSWYSGTKVIAFPNEHESLHCATYGYKMVVWKRGANGAELWEGNRSALKVAATVSEVVDVTGAGDIFMAGFVYAWTLQLLPEDCLRFANSLAGESCRHVGTYVVPKEFAQSILDRLRALRESQPPSPGCSPRSTQSVLPQQLAPGQLVDVTDDEMRRIQYGGWSLGQVIQARAANSRFAVQTHPTAPSTPTESPGAPLPTDQESSDEQDRRLR